MRRNLVAAIVAVSVAAGCGGGDDDRVVDLPQPADRAPPAQAVEPEPTERAGSAEPIIGGLTQGGDVFEITFENDLCTVTGHAESAAGIRIFVLRNLDETGLRPNLNVVELIDGHTWEELVASVSGHGLAFNPLPRPEWALDVDGKPSAAFRYQQDHDLADNERTYAFDLDPGPHAIVAYQYDPIGVWLCAPFEVTAAT